MATSASSEMLEREWVFSSTPIVVDECDRVEIPESAHERSEANYEMERLFSSQEELIQTSWYHRALLGDEITRVRYIPEDDDLDVDPEDDEDEEEQEYL